MPTTLRKIKYEPLPRKRYAKVKKHFTTAEGEKLAPGDILETSTAGAPADARPDAVIELISPFGCRMAWAASEVDFPENPDRQNAFACAALNMALRPFEHYFRAGHTDAEREQIGAQMIERFGRHGICVRDIKIGDLIDALDATGLM